MARDFTSVEKGASNGVRDARGRHIGHGVGS